MRPILGVLFLLNSWAVAFIGPDVIDDAIPVSERGYGKSCYVLGRFACPSAFYAQERDVSFGFDVSLSGNQRLVQFVQQTADKTVDSQEFEDLLSSHEPQIADAGISFFFRGETVSVQLIPWQARFFSQFQNSALPTVDVATQWGREARLHFSGWQTPNWALSLQTRIGERHFVVDEVDIAEAAVGHEFDEKSQQFIFLEPMLGWAEERWLLSARLGEVGFIDEKDERWPAFPALIGHAEWAGRVHWGLTAESSARVNGIAAEISARVPVRPVDFRFVLAENRHVVGVSLVNSNLSTDLSYEAYRLRSSQTRALRLSFGFAF